MVYSNMGYSELFLVLRCIPLPLVILLSFILYFLIGQFSHFFIQSATKDGRLKSFGGDSWRVNIRQGPSSLAPLVLDHNDGVYEVLYLVLEPGPYSVTIFLDHTLCDGYRDPPKEWFTTGKRGFTFLVLFHIMEIEVCSQDH